MAAKVSGLPARAAQRFIEQLITSDIEPSFFLFFFGMPPHS